MDCNTVKSAKLQKKKKSSLILGKISLMRGVKGKPYLLPTKKYSTTPTIGKKSTITNHSIFEP